jgi:predicted ATPase/DNA-binding winged helix-turn-helix (wHTH) protein
LTGALAESHQRSYSFGPFILIPERQLLVEGEKPVRIGGRALDVLTALVERPGQVVDKRELLLRVWPGLAVDEANLKVNMGVIRRALGEGAGHPQYIATVVGRGYRFVAPVSLSGEASPIQVEIQTLDRKHNLPIGTTRIVGRTETIASILREFDNARLVSIVGTGGIGKTTVALAIAEQSIGRFEHGVWFVDLAALKDPYLVPNAIATAVGLTAHSANLTAALGAALEQRMMLLVLDNCEHMIEAVATCAQKILASARNVKILTTSREPLSIKGERVRRLSGLALPPVSSSSQINAEDALGFSAVQLFVDRASDRSATFSLRDADAAIIARICRRLDGLALAIELAATRIDTFRPAELLDRLDDRFRLLLGRRAGPERHRTLAATIDWSYELLADSERTLMRRLSVFSGTFTLSEACRVASDEIIDELQVIDDLGGLVAKSLLAVDLLDTEVTYRMLETTRAYASEKLAATAEFEHVRRLHAHHALDVAIQAKAELAAIPMATWLERYRPKIDDIRNSLDFAFSGRGDEALGVKLTIAAIPFWERLSLLEECRSAVERALEDHYAAHRSEREKLELLLSKGATRLFMRGPVPEVKEAFTMALEVANMLGDTDLCIQCLRGLSQYELWAGDSRASLSYAEQVRNIAAGVGEEHLARKVDGQTGSALHYLGDLTAARKQLEGFLASGTAVSVSAANLSRFEFDQQSEARGSLAMVLWLQGYSDQALKMARHQLEEAKNRHYPVPHCAAILITSVCIAIYVGNFDEAEEMLDFADQFAAEHGLALWSAISTCMRVKLHIDMNRTVDLEAYRLALDELRESGLGMRYPPFLGNYGHVLSLRGDVDGALACINEAIALYSASGQDWGLPEMLMMKGNFIRAAGRDSWFEEAAACYRESIDLARQHGSLTWELRSAMQFVTLWRQAGGNQQAEATLSSAYEKFEEGFWTVDLQRARTLLDQA